MGYNDLAKVVGVLIMVEQRREMSPIKFYVPES